MAGKENLCWTPWSGQGMVDLSVGPKLGLIYERVGEHEVETEAGDWS